MVAENPLDTTIAVVTPENIAFDYQLAGPCRRFPAYLLDVFVRWLGIFALLLLLVMLGVTFGLRGMSFGTTAFFTIAIFIANWFYGTLFEAYFNGRTIGKWICGIRVIDVDGRPVTGRSALLRNLLRTADIAPVLFLNEQVDAITGGFPLIFIVPASTFGILSMLLTQRMQRLGDLAAGTMVVVDERSWRLPVAKVDDPRVPALSSFVPADYRVSRTMARTLGVYVERRHYLTPARRNEIAKHLTDGLIDRFEFRADINPDLLLYALYYKTFLQDSDGEEPDLGPLRGYSPLARDAGKVSSSQLASNGSSPLSDTLASNVLANVKPTATSKPTASSNPTASSKPTGVKKQQPNIQSGALGTEKTKPPTRPNSDGGLL